MDVVDREKQMEFRTPRVLLENREEAHRERRKPVLMGASRRDIFQPVPGDRIESCQEVDLGCLSHLPRAADRLGVVVRRFYHSTAKSTAGRALRVQGQSAPHSK